MERLKKKQGRTYEVCFELLTRVSFEGILSPKSESM